MSLIDICLMVMARFCNLSWRCHHIQQYACTKCKLVLGSSNLSDKEKRNTMGKCIWKSWWYTICLAHGVVFCSWNSSTNLPKCFRYWLVYFENFNSGTKSGFPCIESHAMDTVRYEIYSCLYLWLKGKKKTLRIQNFFRYVITRSSSSSSSSMICRVISR